MHSLRAAVVYFALVFGTGFILGSIRVTLLVPRLGIRNAELLEMPLMLAATVLAARAVVRWFDLPATATVRLATGATALALLLLAELFLVDALQRQTVGQYVTGRDPVSGSVYLALLVVFALMPLLLARAGGRR